MPREPDTGTGIIHNRYIMYNTVKDANGRAYNRTKHLEQRHKMMQHWSDYLDGLQADNVVAVKFGGVA